MNVPVVLQLDRMPETDWHELCIEVLIKDFVEDIIELCGNVLIGMLIEVIIADLVGVVDVEPLSVELAVTDGNCVVEELPLVALIEAPASPVQEKL
jgi:hypothetical protein